MPKMPAIIQNVKPMKILLVCDLYPPEGFGGVQRAVSSLAESLVERGVEVVVLAGGKVNLVEHAKKVKIYRLRNITLPLYQHAPFVAFFGSRVKEIIDVEKPDVVHIELTTGLGWASLTEARKRRIPLVFTLHALPENVNQFLPIWPFNAFFGALFWRWIGLFAENVYAVTAPSVYALAQLTKRFRVRQAVRISNGLDLSEYVRQYSQKEALRKLSLENQKVILYVGRLHHEKSPEVLLGAVKKVVSEIPEAKFVFVGDGPMKNTLVTTSKKEGISSSVSFTGFISDAEMKLYYQAASVFVMPSAQELQGLSVMEAMAYSLPIIVARAGALPELVGQPKNGFTFTKYDKIDLANKIITLLGKGDLEVFGKNSYLQVQAHGLKYTAEKYVELYRSLLENKT